MEAFHPMLTSAGEPNSKTSESETEILECFTSAGKLKSLEKHGKLMKDEALPGLQPSIQQLRSGRSVPFDSPETPRASAQPYTSGCPPDGRARHSHVPWLHCHFKNNTGTIQVQTVAA